MLTPQFMRTFRKHAVVVILFASAVITPSSDPFTLTLVALPLYILFEVSILVSANVVRKQEKAAREESKTADQQF
jgi:sec-independent protein translocase protein TatC